MDSLRKHLATTLHGGLAYDTFESITGEFRPEDCCAIPPGAEHSAWQIVEHMRISLRDILDFSQNENRDYKEREWPREYWPTESAGDWDATLASYKSEVEEMIGLVNDESRDVFAEFPWGDGQTLLREALLAADHAAYHLGELVELKRWLASR